MGGTLRHVRRRRFLVGLAGAFLVNSPSSAAAFVTPEQYASPSDLRKDAAPALKLAIATGRRVVASGAYNIRSQVNINSGEIDFTGAEITFHGWTGSEGGTGTPPTSSYAFLLQDNGRLVGGTFDGGNTVGGLARVSGSRTQVINAKVRRFRRYGLTIRGSNNLVERCVLEDFGNGVPAATVVNGIFITGQVESPSQGNIVRACTIRRMNYRDWRAGKNDSNGVQVLGNSAPKNMDPDSPEISNAVIGTLIEDCHFEDIDRRAVKIQESYTTVRNCRALRTGGIRPVGGTKKLKGLRILNNRLTSSTGFALNATVIDSEFRGNEFEGLQGPWWTTYSEGLAVRCVIEDNIVGDGKQSTGVASNAGSVRVGQFSKAGRYDRDLTFRNNRSRTGSAATSILVGRNARNITVDGRRLD